MPTDLLLLRRRYTVSSGKSKCNHVKCNSCNPLFFLFAQQTCPDSSVFNPTTSQCSASCTGGYPFYFYGSLFQFPRSQVSNLTFFFSFRCLRIPFYPAQHRPLPRPLRRPLRPRRPRRRRRPRRLPAARSSVPNRPERSRIRSTARATTSVATAIPASS